MSRSLLYLSDLERQRSVFLKIGDFFHPEILACSPNDLKTCLIFLLLLASTKALPVKEGFKDDIDQELQTRLDRRLWICWEGVGDLEEVQQAEICIEKFFPEIRAACESVLSKTDTENIIREVFTCFWEYVLDNDTEGLVQKEVRSYPGEINNQVILDEADVVDEVDEVGEAEYIIGTSCTIEAFDDSGEINETKIEECGCGGHSERDWIALGAELCPGVHA